MDYSLIDFYSQSPDWIKAAIILGVPAFLLGLLWLLLWYRVEITRIDRVWPRRDPPVSLRERYAAQHAVAADEPPA